MVSEIKKQTKKKHWMWFLLPNQWNLSLESDRKHY